MKFKQGWAELFGYENAANSQWSADTRHGIVLTIWNDVTAGVSEVRQVGLRYEYYSPPGWVDGSWPARDYLHRAQQARDSGLPVRVAALSGKRGSGGNKSEATDMQVLSHLYWLRVLYVGDDGTIHGYFLTQKDYVPMAVKKFSEV